MKFIEATLLFPADLPDYACTDRPDDAVLSGAFDADRNA